METINMARRGWGAKWGNPTDKTTVHSAEPGALRAICGSWIAAYSTAGAMLPTDREVTCKRCLKAAAR